MRTLSIKGKLRIPSKLMSVNLKIHFTDENSM